MKTPTTNLNHHERRLAGTGVRALLAGLALLLVCSCEEEEGVFERRYALTEIPGFGLEDHIALLDHKDPNLRYLALANLLQMGVLEEQEESDEKGEGMEQLRAKLQAMLTDPAPKVRAIAAFAPINRAGKGAEERLLARLDDAHSAVRVEAVVSLGAGARGDSGELSPAGTDRVAGLLDDENILVRLHALEALGSSGSTQRLEAMTGKIERTLARRETPEILKSLEILGQIESDAAEKILMGRLDDQDERIVRVAIEGLTSRRPQALEEWLIGALADGQMPEEFLLGSLAKIATLRSRATALAMIEHPNANVRSHCAAILEKIGDQSSFDALAAAFDRILPDLEKRIAAPSGDPIDEEEEFLALLQRIITVGEELETYTFDKDGLQSMLRSTRKIDQVVAMVHLAKESFYDAPFLENQEENSGFVAALKTLAVSKSPLLRSFAYEALGNSRRSETGEILVGGIADPVSQVRSTALESLIDYTASTGRRGPLRSVYERRSEFEPTTYADDEPNLLMRQRLERAIRSVEPSWASLARAKAELQKGKTNTASLLAAEFLAPRQEGMSALLNALATGSAGAKTFALRVIEENPGKQHVAKLRDILAAETDPKRKKAIAKIIENAAE